MNTVTSRVMTAEAGPDRESLILDAVLTVLGREGISGVSMRAVARQAGVALGLVNYYFEDKTTLIASALREIGHRDRELVMPGAGAPADELRAALGRVVAPELLDSDYLALRLSLWSLAAVDPLFAEINRIAQAEYRDGLAALVAAARPELTEAEAASRAADVLVIQNGIWLTSTLITDPDAVQRALDRCEQLAFD